MSVFHVAVRCPLAVKWVRSCGLSCSSFVSVVTTNCVSGQLWTDFTVNRCFSTLSGRSNVALDLGGVPYDDPD